MCASTSERAMHALLAVYPDRPNANAAVTYLQQMEKSAILRLDGIAVVAKDHEGKVTGEIVGQPTGKRGAARGAAFGAVVGLIFPPGVLGATIVGAGIGGLTGRLRGRSAPRAGLQELGERLEPGSVGVVVVADDADADQVAKRLTGCDALHRLRVDAATLVALRDADGAATDG
jgi:uncharacterized membrane protein